MWQSSFNLFPPPSVPPPFPFQFVRTLARFRPISNRDLSKNTPLNSREEKLRFAFKMYDINDDDKIHHNEILDVLHMMVSQPNETIIHLILAEKHYESIPSM